MLTGPEIRRRITQGEITIDPPDAIGTVNPNSLNLRLSHQIVMYVVERTETPSGRDQVYHNGQWVDVIDIKRPHPVRELTIPDRGLVLVPGELYLGCTIERTSVRGLAPQIEGRSSVARLGISVHLTAGFGDDGFDGDWTLEITTVYPVRVYAGFEICQISFDELTGERQPYAGKYQQQRGPKPSQLWREFQ